MIVEHRLHRLARLAKADPNKRFDRLFREITQVDFLMYAFEQIQDNDGSYTPGIDGKTKRHWNLSAAERTAEMLLDGTYAPQPVRRVYIPKKSGKVRPLGIPTFTDRVVQSAIKLILEALYEPVFLHCSHGFRPGRGCHTALNAICNFSNVRIDWVVEGDIKGFFDNVNHQILMRLLHRRIKDDRLLKLIAEFLKAGYFEREMWNPTKEGTPQGGIISPLLANIYLHEMDKYIEDRFQANQTPAQTVKECCERRNPEYKRLSGQISRVRKKLEGKLHSNVPKEELVAQLQALLKQRRSVPNLSQPIKPRITYVRYADDWVLVLRNIPKSEADRMKEDLTQWLWNNLRLVLSPEKTVVTHITDGFVFLGYKIMAKTDTKKRPPRVKLVIPYDSVTDKIKIIRERCSHTQVDEVDMIRNLNAVLRGWMNYYACATAPSRMFKKLLREAYWAYGNYVAKKHNIYFSEAAHRWIQRCPSSRQNQNGNQKTWTAMQVNAKGEMRTMYLICSASSRRSLREVALQIYRNSHNYDAYVGNEGNPPVVSGEPCAVKAASTVR